MSHGQSLDRYREQWSIRGVVVNYMGVFLVSVFFVCLAVVALGVAATGANELSAIIFAWDILITAIFIVFGLVPLYATKFLPDYNKF